MEANASLGEAEPAKKPFMDRMLDWIEKAGNKVPHPAIIFVGLIVFIVLLSQILDWLNVSVTYEVAQQEPAIVEEIDLTGTDAPEVFPIEDYTEAEFEIETETTAIKGLLTIDGIRFMFSEFIPNFAGFTVVSVIFVAMMGVGVAEGAGLMGALIRKLVSTAPPGLLTFIIVFVGCLSSVATDAGYLILIPLGAAAFLSVGRHPLVGLAAAYAGVSVSFAVNILITPLDSLLTGVTNEAIGLVDPEESLGITANLYFAVASTLFTALVVTFVTQRMVEPRLGKFKAPVVEANETDAAAASEPEPLAPEAESKGLKWALIGVAASVVVITLLTVIPGAPLRNPENGDIIGDSPFMDSLTFLISIIFLVAGLGFGFGAKTYQSSVDVIKAIEKTFAGLASLIFLLLIISQFIGFFNFSNMPTIAAVAMADVLEEMDIGAVALLVGLILVICLLDMIMPGALPKWAIFAPIFIPLFMRLGVAPQTVLAAYRVGDSPMNVITPLMVYLPFIVLVAQRYQPSAGLGTIISLMIPYTVVILITWVIFFVLWYVIGIPLGPGYPVEI